jgi:hypothetical protein
MHDQAKKASLEVQECAIALPTGQDWLEYDA